MEENFTIELKDGKIYKLSKKAAELSDLLRGMKAVPEDVVIPIDNSDSKIFEKTIKYLVHFDGKSPEEIEKPLLSTDMKKITDEWSAQFVDNLSIDELVNMIALSHYLKINCLLNLCCAKMVSLCKGKSESEIFQIFGVSSDYFSPEKKQQIKEENKWVDEIFQ